MPDYRAVFFFEDIELGTTTKEFTGTFADDATATTQLGNLQTAITNIVDCGIIKAELTKVIPIAAAANAGSTVFRRVSATMQLAGGVKKANLSMPSPVAAIFAGNSLITTNAQWIAFQNQFISPNWTISDGEYVTGTIKGDKKYAGSGRTNLPS